MLFDRQPGCFVVAVENISSRFVRFQVDLKDSKLICENVCFNKTPDKYILGTIEEI